MQARVSQPQRSAAQNPSVVCASPSKTVTSSVPPSRSSHHLVSTSGPCGLEIYGDIKLLDFANLEGLLTPEPESESTALPSPSQLSDILNTATSRSGGHQDCDQSRASLAEDTHILTPFSLPPGEIRNSRAISNGVYPGEVAQETVKKSSTESPEGNWINALHIAVQRGHIRIVRVLLQHGVDCNQKDGEGLTPLIHSIISDHEDVMISLIQNGARACETDNHGRNAIHWAILQRREALLKVLLKHCSGDQQLIDGHDLDGKTPLHTAVDIGFEAGVDILLENGADLNSRAVVH